MSAPIAPVAPIAAAPVAAPVGPPVSPIAPVAKQAPIAPVAPVADSPTIPAPQGGGGGGGGNTPTTPAPQIGGGGGGGSNTPTTPAPQGGGGGGGGGNTPTNSAPQGGGNDMPTTPAPFDSDVEIPTLSPPTSVPYTPNQPINQPDRDSLAPHKDNFADTVGVLEREAVDKLNGGEIFAITAAVLVFVCILGFCFGRKCTLWCSKPKHNASLIEREPFSPAEQEML